MIERPQSSLTRNFLASVGRKVTVTVFFEDCKELVKFICEQIIKSSWDVPVKFELAKFHV